LLDDHGIDLDQFWDSTVAEENYIDLKEDCSVVVEVGCNALGMMVVGCNALGMMVEGCNALGMMVVGCNWRSVGCVNIVIVYSDMRAYLVHC
jgi:hypothetical protein